jgi:hypothetical protein
VSISDYYTETAVYYSQATSTGWGSESGFSTAGTTFSAAINPVSGNVRIAAGREALFADHKVFCSDTVSLDVHQKVVYAGDTYDCVFVKDTLNMGHHKLAYLKVRDG